MTANVCLYNQKGYCKYGNTFRNLHVNEKFDITTCDGSQCSKRHPKSCFYFEKYKKCKFGNYCKFSHECDQRNPEDETEINIMKTIIKSQEDKIAKLETDIDEVKSNLVDLSKKFEELSSLKSDQNLDIFQCAFCEKNYKTKSGY